MTGARWEVFGVGEQVLNILHVFIVFSLLTNEVWRDGSISGYQDIRGLLLLLQISLQLLESAMTFQVVPQHPLFRRQLLISIVFCISGYESRLTTSCRQIWPYRHGEKYKINDGQNIMHPHTCQIDPLVVHNDKVGVWKHKVNHHCPKVEQNAQRDKHWPKEVHPGTLSHLCGPCRHFRWFLVYLIVAELIHFLICFCDNNQYKEIN